MVVRQPLLQRSRQQQLLVGFVGKVGRQFWNCYLQHPGQICPGPPGLLARLCHIQHRLCSFGGPFFLLLIASFGIATYSILAKYALGHLDFWHVYAISSIGSAPAFAYAVHAFRAWPQVRLAGRSAEGLAVTLSAHGVIGLAFLACLWAFELGPVSLSSAIMAARPVIVLTYATLIGILLPKALTERTAGPALLEKGMAAALVTTGVGAMSLL